MIINGLRRRARDKHDNLILQSDTESLKSSQITSESHWQKTPVQNYGSLQTIAGVFRTKSREGQADSSFAQDEGALRGETAA